MKIRGARRGRRKRKKEKKGNGEKKQDKRKRLTSTFADWQGTTYKAWKEMRERDRKWEMMRSEGNHRRKEEKSTN